MKITGIDLSTSNSLVGYFDGNSVKLFRNAFVIFLSTWGYVSW